MIPVTQEQTATSFQKVSPWPAIVSSLLLLAVASLQIYLSLTANLSAWKGGGFGMFSTNDHGKNRYLRVYVTALERTEEIDVPEEFVKLGSRSRLFPSGSILRILAQEIFNKFRSGGIPAESVRIEVWQIQYEKDSIAPSIRKLNEFTYSGK